MRIEQEMTPSRFQALTDAFGGNIERWPAAERESARAFAAQNVNAVAALTDARGLDRLLAMVPPAPDATPGLIDRIVAAAPMQARGSETGNVIVLARLVRGSRVAVRAAGGDVPGSAERGSTVARAAEWQLSNGRLAGAGGMLAASLLIGIWLGASGLGSSLPSTAFGPRQSASESDPMSDIVQAAFPPDLGDANDEESL